MKNLIKEYEEIFLESPKYYIDTGGRFEIIGNHTDHNHGLCIVANCSLRIKAVLDKDDEIVEIQANYSLKGFSFGNNYTSDFVCKKSNGELKIRECIYRKNIMKPSVIKLLDEGRNYWLSRGVDDWGIVIDG